MSPPKSRDTRNADMIEDYRIHLQSAGRSSRTINAAMDLLYRLDRELPRGLAEAYPQELKVFLAHEGPQMRAWKANTRATFHAHICGFFDWATDEDDPRLDYNPAARLPRPKVRPGVPDPTPDDVVQLCVGPTARQPYRLICILAGYAGFRPVEIAAICREDVNEQWIKTVGKGNKPAIIPTEPAVWRAVRDLPPGPLVRTRTGQPMSAKKVSGQTARYLRRQLGVNTTLRHFRDWHGTWLRRHFDLRIVQERMRHSSLNTTQKYTAVTQAELWGSAGALPDFTAPDKTEPDEGETAA